MSNAMLTFTNECGIQHQHTVRARPQQNGIAERATCVLSERITAMLQESGLAMAFWGEALAALVHVWNHCPTAALDSCYWIALNFISITLNAVLYRSHTLVCLSCRPRHTDSYIDHST
jgi:hypothetical protein